MNLVIWMCQVASVVSKDHVFADLLPVFAALVQVLVQISVIAKGLVTDFAMKNEIVEALFEGRNLD
jgi:hypothetical protein